MSTGKVRHIHKLSGTSLIKLMLQIFWLLATDEETEKLVNIGVRAFKDGATQQGLPN